jgi:UDP-N-acetylmuramoyl-tripeptide--D-alanyl-D-alanine ligase
MIELDPDRIAAEAEAEIVVRGGGGRAERASIDSRETGPGDLFFGLPGESDDGGRFAAAALEGGGWGAVVTPARARELVAEGLPPEAWLYAAEEPLRALQRLARGWRRHLGCPLVGITGSTGKTSVKDITRALLPRRVHASPENYNTEIGMPLSLLAAPPETEILVMEMAMRGMGQIAELCEIAEPDIAAITNVGPVHLELLGTVEAIAEAKAEIIGGLGSEGRAVVPEGAEALEPHLHDSLSTVTFGPGGDVFAIESQVSTARTDARIASPLGEAGFTFPFEEAHNLTNALCAVAIGVALGFAPEEMAPRAAGIGFSRLRGERVALRGEILLLNDCYNANPISMRAAVEHLGAQVTRGRRIAILGGMAELGPDGPQFHEEIGALVRELGIAPLIGVGELARDYMPDEWAPDPLAAAELARGILQPEDVALVKGSRSVGLEQLTDVLRAEIGEAAEA